MAFHQMTYWRMQLHPSSSEDAVMHTVQSLAAGYIGLDFAGHVGDLLEIQQSDLPDNQKDYWAFAHEMEIDDRILIMAHHFPVALVRVAGPYNYIRAATPEIGVWFRHFRKVDEISFYADYRTNAQSWESITMTNTISPLRDSNSRSYRLIDTWIRELD
jgi:hypothetical protein